MVSFTIEQFQSNAASIFSLVFCLYAESVNQCIHSAIRQQCSVLAWCCAYQEAKFETRLVYVKLLWVNLS